MFASMRKFSMNPRAAPIDDIESLLYLVCFCFDGFYLPWLHDYINQLCTDHFILSRMQRARKCHRYFYKQMPGPISNALRYIHKLGDELQQAEQKQSKIIMSISSQSSFQRDFRYPPELNIDYEYLKTCF